MTHSHTSTTVIPHINRSHRNGNLNTTKTNKKINTQMSQKQRQPKDPILLVKENRFNIENVCDNRNRSKQNVGTQR